MASSGELATVSVIVPAYEAASFIVECLDSISTQEGAFALEVLVIDDGSRDATAQLARQQGARVIIQANRGPAAARNAGLAAAGGAFVAFLDADDLWPPGKLALQLEILTRCRQAAMVFGDCRQFDERGPRPRTVFESGGLGAAAWGSAELLPDAFARLLEENFITTGSVVARREVLSAMGGFAEDLRLVEDLELWLRVARRHPIAWTSHVCLLRRRHASNASRNAEDMAVAYLEVLRRASADTAVPAAKVAHLAAREHLHLARLALARGDPRASVARAARSFALDPGIHAGWVVVQATLARLSGGRRAAWERHGRDRDSRTPTQSIEAKHEAGPGVELTTERGREFAGEFEPCSAAQPDTTPRIVELAGEMLFDDPGQDEVSLSAADRSGPTSIEARAGGVFARAVRDSEGLTLRSDPCGLSSIFWCRTTGGSVRYASRASLLWDARHSAARPSRSALHEYLRFLDIAPPRCWFSGVSVVEPGVTLRFVDGGEPQQIAAPPAPRLKSTNADETSGTDPVSIVGHLLRRSIAACVNETAAPAAFLSGGVDSALVCAIAARLHPGLTAVTIGFDGTRYDEAPVAGRVAASLGIPHRVLRFDRSACLDAFDRLARGMDQPMADPSTPVTVLAFEHCRDHFDVVLDGTGADEAVGDMPPRHLRVAVDSARFLRPKVRQSLADLLRAWPRLGRYAPVFDFEHPADTMIRWHGFTRREIEELCGEPVSFADTQFYRTFEHHRTSTHFQRYSALLKTMPCERLVQASHITGMRMRYPFCDRHVEGFLETLPERLRWRPGHPKRILRELLERYVPRALWSGPKHGFVFPLHEFLTGDNHALVRRHVLNGTWLDLGLVRADVARRYAQRYMAGEEALKFRVWALTVLGAWLEHHPCSSPE